MLTSTPTTTLEFRFNPLFYKPLENVPQPTFNSGNIIKLASLANLSNIFQNDNLKNENHISEYLFKMNESKDYSPKEVFKTIIKLLLSVNINKNQDILPQILLNILHVLKNSKRNLKKKEIEMILKDTQIIVDRLCEILINKSNNNTLKFYSILIINETYQFKKIAEKLSFYNYNNLNSNLINQSLVECLNFITNKLPISNDSLNISIIKESLKYLTNTNQYQNIPIVMKLISLQISELDVSILSYINKLYLSLENKYIITSNDKLMKYYRKFLYMTIPNNFEKMAKLNLVVEFYNNLICYHYNNLENLNLKLLKSLKLDDISLILIQILTEILTNEQDYWNKESNHIEALKFKNNILLILGKLITLDDDVFTFFSDDQVLIKLLIENYLIIPPIELQQSIIFFLVNCISACQIKINSENSSIFEKSLKFQNFIYIDKLNDLITIFYDLIKTSKINEFDSDKKVAIITAVVETIELLIQNASQFDRMQMIQYRLYSLMIDILEISRDNNVTKSTLKSILMLTQEYRFAYEFVNKSNDGKIPQIARVVKILLEEFHGGSHKDEQNQEMIKSIMCLVELV